jgi:hypothetical protein
VRFFSADWTPWPVLARIQERIDVETTVRAAY